MINRFECLIGDTNMKNIKCSHQPISSIYRINRFTQYGRCTIYFLIDCENLSRRLHKCTDSSMFIVNDTAEVLPEMRDYRYINILSMCYWLNHILTYEGIESCWTLSFSSGDFRIDGWFSQFFVHRRYRVIQWNKCFVIFVSWNIFKRIHIHNNNV